MPFETPRFCEPELADSITTPGKTLEIISLVYLFIPLFLFFFGFLRPIYGVLASAILLAALVICFRRRLQGLTQRPFSLGPRDGYRLTIVVVLSLLWMFLAGVGGFTGQAGDYIKHNTILLELINDPWPPRVPDLALPGVTTWLVYYPAWYLPAAVVGKLLGWNAAYAFLTLWTALGVFLSIAWLMRIQRGLSIQTFLIFIFFGGLDIIGYGLLRPDGQMIRGDSYFDWWSLVLCYPSNSTSLDYAPQHALPAWILMSMVLHDVFRRKRLSDLGLYLLAALLWSPFVAVGLFPFVVFACIEKRFKGCWTFRNLIAAPVLGLVIALYYLSRRYSTPADFYWSGQTFVTAWHLLPLFWLLEFGLYAIFCYDSRLFENCPGRGRWWWLTIAILMIFPIRSYGMNNDLAMRGGVPALFFLMLVIDNRLRVPSISRDTTAKILLALLAFGSFAGVANLVRGLDEVSLGFPDEARRHPRFETEERRDVSIQYMGDPDTFFFRHLARRWEAKTPQNHVAVSFDIIPTGEKNPRSEGTEVWIWRVYTVDGVPIPLDSLQHGENWNVKVDQDLPRLFTFGNKPSPLHWEGEIDQDLVILFLSHAWSGKVRVRWMGRERTIDLYSNRRHEKYRLLLPLEGWGTDKSSSNP